MFEIFFVGPLHIGSKFCSRISFTNWESKRRNRIAPESFFYVFVWLFTQSSCSGLLASDKISRVFRLFVSEQIPKDSKMLVLVVLWGNTDASISLSFFRGATPLHLRTNYMFPPRKKASPARKIPPLKGVRSFFICSPRPSHLLLR